MRYRRVVLGLCLCAYFAVRYAQVVVSPVIPAIIGEFSVSRGTIGLSLTGMWAVYALSQLPSGTLGDRYGERRIVVAALLLAGAGSLAMAAAPSFPAFVGAVVLLGVGAGLYYNAATALLTRLFAGVGRAIGTHRIGSQIAGMVAPVVAAALVAAGWRAAVLTGAGIAGVALLAFAAGVRPTEPAAAGMPLRDAADPRRIAALLSRRDIAFATALSALGEFALVATTTFLPTFLVEHHGMGIGLAGLLFSGYYAVVAVGHPASGWLSDRAGRDVVIGGAMLSGVAGYALLVVGRFPAVVVAAGLVGLAMTWGSPLQSRVMDGLADSDRGVGFGSVRTVYLLVGALGSTAVGTLADAAGWGVAFGLLSGLLALGAAGLAANRALRLGM